MNLVDLHCDTIGECYKRKLALRNNNLHFDLERASGINKLVQSFAVWIPDELRGKEASEYFENVSDYLFNQIGQNDDKACLLNGEPKAGVNAVLAVEGGSAAGGSLEGLERLHEKGVRLITLTWNARNEIAGGAFSDGGFTQFGKEFVKKAESLGIIVDASHLNRESFFELADFAGKPFIASHSNADIVNKPKGKKRNLTFEQVKIINEFGGVVGINFYNAFLDDENAEGIDGICRQLEWFLENGFEKSIAIGSDFDGCTINGQINGVEKMKSLYEELLKRGYPQKCIDDMFFNNAMRLLNK